MNSKKYLIISITISTLLLFGFGITYARFTYNRTGVNNKLILGDIYMHYKETNSINMEGAMPQSTYSENNYFEFTIDGKNTYEKEDIWYEIVLSHGDNHATRTERIQDILLKFRLVEVVNGEEQELFTNRNYSDLTSKRIWVDTIPANTTSEIEKTYRLYMWISDATIIGNTSDANYDMDTWSNQVYASIKVNVTGDFVEKDIATDASCFTTKVYTAYVHNSNITDAEVSLCTNYLTSIWGAEENNTLDGETYESFCRGTGTRQGYTFQSYINHENSNDDLTTENLDYFLENGIIIDEGEGIAILDYDASCGSDVIIPKTIDGYPVTMITDVVGSSIPNPVANNSTNDYDSNNLNYNFNEYNASYLVGAPPDGAFQNKGLTSIVIPNSVTYIGFFAFYSNQLTNITIPSSVTYIGVSAFSYNQLRNVVILNSVTYIGRYAFRNNQLTNITIPNSVTYIGYEAFSSNQLTSVVIPDSVTYLSCIAFDTNVAITKRDDLVCE